MAAEEADQLREPSVQEVIMAAVAAGHDSQESIVDYVGMTRKKCTPRIKELVAECVLVEETGRHNIKTYRLRKPTQLI